jgi:hypothetical protein
MLHINTLLFAKTCQNLVVKTVGPLFKASANVTFSSSAAHGFLVTHLRYCSIRSHHEHRETIYLDGIG